MTVTATLRYPGKNTERSTFTQEVPQGTTAGAFSKALLASYEKQKNIHFEGVNLAVLIKGRIVTDDHLLKDGDDILIFPVATGG